MEDLFGIVIFLVFALFSIGSRLKRKKEDQVPAPKYPGPVAGPGMPGFPRPAWPSGPSTAPPRAQRQATRQVEPGEGLPGGEGVASGMEGPPTTSAEEEGARFAKESDRSLGELTRTAQPVYSTAQTGVFADMTGTLTDRSAMARAIVLVEVLGRPKGRRRR